MKYIAPIYPCVMWDGTNLEEIQTVFPKFVFGESGDILTVSGSGMSGNIEKGWYLYAIPGPGGLSVSFTDPVDNINFMQINIPS